MISRLLATAGALLFCASASAQRDFSDISISTTAVRNNIYVLQGAGGNVGVAVGDEGAFLVDDQYAPLSERIIAAVEALHDAPIRFVLNTHYHGDHTGGNENLGGRGALTVAHDNVRARMGIDTPNPLSGGIRPPAPAGNLPVVTFGQTMTFHWNGEEIHAFHVGGAHTDGDAVVHFRGSDVIHAGDVYFNHWYPFIDSGAGGTLDGLIAAVETILELAGPDTIIIAGHGEPLTRREDLLAYLHMLQESRTRVAALIAAGKTRDEVLAINPTAQFDPLWGQNFITPERWLGILYDLLAAEND